MKLSDMSCFSPMRSRSKFKGEDPIEATSISEVILISSDDEDDTASDEDRIHIIESSDDEDLPDLIFINETRETTNKDNEEKCPSMDLKRWNQNKCDSEPPVKVCRTENKVTSQWENSFDLALPLLKRNMSNSFLRGGLKGESINVCNRNFTSCYETHNNQPIANCTPMHTKALFETMMEDENLHLFALRAMAYRTVSYKQYLDPSLLNLLLQYLFGSEEKYEMPNTEGLHLGISILYKLLEFHPPCKKGMHHIYSKLCQDWFRLLLQKVRVVLLHVPSPSVSKDVSLQENIQKDEKEQDDNFSDYTSVIKKKANEKKEKYLRRTRAEKIHHLSTLAKFFSKVIEHSFFQWSIRHWQRKASALFRKDICPILSEVVWGSSTWGNDWGSVNSTVQDLFALYCGSSKEPSLHQSLSTVIGVCAAILHRKEMSAFPEMGDMTRTFAYKLYLQIKASADLEVNLRNIHPDWLKFHISSLLLGVDQPANFFKTKERISKVLNDKNKSQDQTLYPNFCVETVCRETIKAMMGMVQLKSSVPEECNLTKRILEDEQAWFSKNLDEGRISDQIKIIKGTLSLPLVKKLNYCFDGFENC